MSLATAEALLVRGARVMDAAGGFAVRDVHIAGGRFTGFAADAHEGAVLDARGMWMIPGVYDCHTHIAWNDFHADAREQRSAASAAAATAEALGSTLRAGVTVIRDAGGADAALRDAVAEGLGHGPTLQVAVDMLGAAQASAPGELATHTRAVLDGGGDWIKLVATGGVAGPAGSRLDPKLTRGDIEAAVAVAAARGARVMVHTWGGVSADWAIEAGVASIEHGIFLTREQLEAAARAGVTLVPTLTIYELVHEMVRTGELAGVALETVAEVVQRHQAVVRLARDAGVPLALGSDFSTPAQHGTNLVEIAALMRAGLPPEDALLAATVNGARLLADPHGGVIAPGMRADAVLLRTDPTDPATFDSPATVAAVIQRGAIVHRADADAGA